MRRNMHHNPGGTVDFFGNHRRDIQYTHHLPTVQHDKRVSYRPMVKRPGAVDDDNDYRHIRRLVGQFPAPAEARRVVHYAERAADKRWEDCRTSGIEETPARRSGCRT